MNELPEIRVVTDRGGLDPDFGVNYHMQKMRQLAHRKNPDQMPIGHRVLFNAFVEGQSEPIAGAYLQITYDFGVTEAGWVDPRFAAKGAGRKLFDVVEAFAKKAGCKRLIATTVGFYESDLYIQKMGFEVFARLPDCPEGSELIYYQKRI